MNKEEIKLEYLKAFDERFKTPNGVNRYEHWAGFAIDDFIAEFIVNKLTIPSVGSSLNINTNLKFNDWIKTDFIKTGSGEFKNIGNGETYRSSTLHRFYIAEKYP